jgi:carbohydrate diacid regulator
MLADRQFERVALAVTERTAELLCARVWVCDERGTIIASSDGNVDWSPLAAGEQSQHASHLRVPLYLGAQSGEVVVATPANGEVISPRLARVLVELVINQAIVAMTVPNQQELKSRFIHDLLIGSAGNDANILRKGHILGMDLSLPRAVILIDATDYILVPNGIDPYKASEARMRRRAQLIIASVVNFFHLPSDTICAYIGGGEVVILKASSTQDLIAWTDQNEPSAANGHDKIDQPSPSWANLTALKRAAAALLVRLRHDTNAAINIGIGRYHPGVHGLARSYQDARAALSLGRHFHGHNRCHCLDGLGIAAFIGVSDERTKIDLARHLLSPLDHEPDLLETLDVFFQEECSPTATRSRLAIHRNTLSYRLSKVASLTGLDPRHFDDAVQIRLALLLSSLPTTHV